jgi:hypothetical protein
LAAIVCTVERALEGELEGLRMALLVASDPVGAGLGLLVAFMA